MLQQHGAHQVGDSHQLPLTAEKQLTIHREARAMTDFLHQDTGEAKAVGERATAKATELKASASPRTRALVDATLGALAVIVGGVPAKAQATVTAQVSEQTEKGHHRVTKAFIDVTIVPAPADAAPSEVVAEQPTASAPRATAE